MSVGKLVIRSPRLAMFATSLLCLTASGQAQDNSYLPTMSAVKADLVSVSSAKTYYSSNSSATASPRPARIDELALALNNDPANIYYYVKNKIQFEPRFGIQKGALGASLAKSGTSFDQAHLLAELLWASGHSTARFAVGEVTLTAQQFSNWFGIDDADVACEVLASGGIPASVNGSSSCSSVSGSVNSVTMLHAWVRFDGKDLDPSLKNYDYYSGINVGSNSGIGGSGFYQTATNGRSNTSAVVTGVNRSNMRSALQTGAEALLSNIADGKTTPEVFGGRRLVPETHRPLDEIVNAHTFGTSTTLYSEGQIPDIYRTKVTIESDASADLAGMDLTYFVDEIYGDRLTFVRYDPNCVSNYYCNGSSPKELRLLRGHTSPDQVYHYGGVTNGLYKQSYADLLQAIAGDAGEIRATIDMPYAAESGSYVDDTIKIDIPDKELTEFFVQVGPTTQQEYIAYERLARLNPFRFFLKDGGPDPVGCVGRGVYFIVENGGHELAGNLDEDTALDIDDSCPGNTWYTSISHEYTSGTQPDIYRGNFFGDEVQADRDYMVRQWGVAYSLLTEALGNTTENHIVPHFNIGVSVGGVERFIFDVESRLSIITPSGASNDTTAALSTLAAFASDLERKVIDIHHSKSNFGAANSAVQLLSQETLSLDVFDQVNFDPDLFSNIHYLSAFSTTITPLGQEALDRMQSYVDAGYTIIVSTDARVSDRMIVWNPDGDSVAFTTSLGLYKGSQLERTNGSNHMPEGSPDFFAESLAIQMAAKADVALSTGDLIFTDGGDISVGSGAYPYSLTFNRSYQSNSTTSGPFGRGWSHNFDIQAHLGGSLMEWMGHTSPKRAAGFYTALNAAYQAALNGSQIENFLITSVAAEWWSEGAEENTLSISGLGGEQFVMLVDGSWDAGLRSNATLNFGGQLLSNANDPTSSIPFTYYPGDGSKVTFEQVYGLDVHFLSSRDDQDQSIYLANKIQNFAQIEKHEFPNGVDVYYEYNERTGVLQEVSNNVNSSNKLTFESHAGAFCAHFNRDNASVMGVSLGNISHISGINMFNECDATLFAYSPHNWESILSASNGVYEVEYEVDRPDSSSGLSYPKGTRFLKQVVRPDGHDAATIYEYRTYTLVLEAYYAPDDSNIAFMSFDYSDAIGQSGRIKSVTDKRGNSITYAVMPGAGTRTDALGNASIEFFDADNNLYQHIDALGQHFGYAYDTLGRMTQADQPNGQYTTYTYDEWHNQTSTTHHPVPALGGASETTSSEFVPVSTSLGTIYSLPKSSTDARGATTSFGYSADGQIDTITLPMVDTSGNGSPDTNPVATFDYNGVGQLTYQQSATGIETVATYQNGHLATLTVNPTGKKLKTVYEYDKVGNVCRTLGPRAVAAAEAGGSTLTGGYTSSCDGS